MVGIVICLLIVVAFGYPIVFRLLANVDNVLGRGVNVLWKMMLKFYELGGNIPFVGFLFSICLVYMKFIDRVFGKPSQNNGN